MVRHRALKVAGSIISVALLAASIAGAAPRRPGPPPGTLRVDGRWLKDAQGRVLILHGVNAVWKIDAPGAAYYPPETAEGFLPADADMIRDLGFNVVRLGWIWRGLEAQRFAISADYLDQIARVAGLLADRNVYSLVDSHQDMLNEKYSGEGAPDWATRDDGLPNNVALGADLGFPGNYLTPATSRAFDHLYSTFRADYARAWSAVAERFARKPYVLGYDILNEPWPGTQWPTCAQPVGCAVFDRVFFQPFQDAAARAIRAQDPHHIAFYEPHVLFNFGAGSWLTKPPADLGSQIGLSFHDYCLAGDIGPIVGVPELGEVTKPMCPAFDGLVFDNSEATAAAMGAAPLLSEFGAGDDLPELERFIDLAEEHMTGWIYWQYKNWHDPTGANGPEGLFTDDADLGTLKVEKAMLLSRAYPMAIAGMPTRYSFDPQAHVFEMDYASAAGVKAATVVFVPPLHYPDGYEVVVTGAKVTSPPGATYLRLKNTGGDVHVEVRPVG